MEKIMQKIMRSLSYLLTGKIFDDCIKDMGFNPYLHQKPIGVLV